MCGVAAKPVSKRTTVTHTRQQKEPLKFSDSALLFLFHRMVLNQV